MKKNLSKLKECLFENTSSRQIVMKNTLRLWIGELFVKWWYFFAMFLLARHLWSKWYGLYSYYISLAWFFIFFADFWIATWTTYYISKMWKTFNNILKKLFKIKIILWIITIILLTIYITFLTSDSVTIWIVFWIFIIIKSYTELIYWHIRSLEHTQYEVICKVSWMIVFLIGCALVISYDLWVLEIWILHWLQQFTSFILWYKLTKDIWDRDGEVKKSNPPSYQYILKEAFPYAIMILWGLLYFSIDIVMVKYYLGDTETWLYSAAVNLYQAYYLPASLITLVLLPRLTKLGKKAKDIFSKGILTFFIMWLALLLLNFVAGEYIITLAFGESFLWSAPYLAILWYIIPARYISYYLWTQITWSGMQEKRSKLILLCAFINIIFNIYAIPQWWVMWAIYATIITEIVLLTWYFTIYRNNNLFI